MTILVFIDFNIHRKLFLASKKFPSESYRPVKKIPLQKNLWFPSHWGKFSPLLTTVWKTQYWFDKLPKSFIKFSLHSALSRDLSFLCVLTKFRCLDIWKYIFEICTIKPIYQHENPTPCYFWECQIGLML